MIGRRRLRVGVLGTEFFDETLGRMGGFGWAARQLVRVLGESVEQPIDVVLLAGSRRGPSGERMGTSHGVPLFYGSGDSRRDALRLLAQRLDLLITIDWSHRYIATIRSLPRTPVVVWIRDPRSPAEAAAVASLRLPDGATTSDANGSGATDETVALLRRRSQRLRRSIAFGATDEFLLPRFRRQYGVDLPSGNLLPNPLTIERTCPVATEPTVAFLGRLDPVKRPWLVFELARRNPDVRFEMAGGRYIDEWDPGDVPANVSLRGHLDEAAKADLLSRAWCLVNTSIHEGLPVSVCEALRVGTPLLSTVPSGGVVDRYGVFAGSAGGAGLELSDALDAGLHALVDDPGRRANAGAAGRDWAVARHSVPAFREALRARLTEAGAAGLANRLSPT